MFNFVKDSSKAKLRQAGAFKTSGTPQWTFCFDNNYAVVVA